MTSNTMPRWVVGLLAVVGVVVLGPPALVLLIVALGLLLKPGVIALKVGLVVLAIAFVIRALFGGKPASLPRRDVESIDEIAARLEAREAEERRALDRQLAEALQNPR
ncbi:MAG: hypothetical protein JNM69_05590 [Archangium sp.]|nr:hypothetical protein [Archangium sp.]